LPPNPGGGSDRGSRTRGRSGLFAEDTKLLMKEKVDEYNL
jgi:hypothetical protein